ncbi:MAG: dephospho-CoA kinase [Balneolaceae bacterium]|nr:dephospho-CoA kinase [Balneolaceae bacterium]
MVRIGVTGGIGSGKSTVCRVWEELGAEICQADVVAKELMVTDPEVVREIKEAFGDPAYAEDGSLNRDYLAREAFEKGRVEELNAIVHPRVPAAVRRRIEEAEEKGASAFVYEAALLPGNRRPEFVDYLLMVRAPRKERVQRVAERDGLETDQVEARIRTQQAYEELEHLADRVIRNDGTEQDLREQAEALYREWVG